MKLIVLALVAVTSAFGLPRHATWSSKKHYHDTWPYRYSWTVQDEPTDNDYSHHAYSDGKAVTGSYRVALPDGRVQVVSYKADEFGYVAKVTYEGEAKSEESKSSADGELDNVKSLGYQGTSDAHRGFSKPLKAYLKTKPKYEPVYSKPHPIYPQSDDPATEPVHPKAESIYLNTEPVDTKFEPVYPVKTEPPTGFVYPQSKPVKPLAEPPYPTGRQIGSKKWRPNYSEPSHSQQTDDSTNPKTEFTYREPTHEEPKPLYVGATYDQYSSYQRARDFAYPQSAVGDSYFEPVHTRVGFSGPLTTHRREEPRYPKTFRKHSKHPKVKPVYATYLTEPFYEWASERDLVHLESAHKKPFYPRGNLSDYVTGTAKLYTGSSRGSYFPAEPDNQPAQPESDSRSLKIRKPLRKTSKSTKLTKKVSPFQPKRAKAAHFHTAKFETSEPVEPVYTRTDSVRVGKKKNAAAESVQSKKTAFVEASLFRTAPSTDPFTEPIFRTNQPEPGKRRNWQAGIDRTADDDPAFTDTVV